MFSLPRWNMWSPGSYYLPLSVCLYVSEGQINADSELLKPGDAEDRALALLVLSRSSSISSSTLLLCPILSTIWSSFPPFPLLTP